MNEICINVIRALVDNGIDEEMTTMFLKKGLKDLGYSENKIDEKEMGIVLQQHMLDAIQMFVDEHKAHKIIHKVTLRL